MKSLRFRSILAWILSLVMILGMFSWDSAVTYAAEMRPTAADIPAGTLIIGTHLIHIKGLNMELLTIAQSSAKNSMQESIYYKSEFAGGTWYDITNASGFTEISSEGKPVKNGVVDGLKLTHWTKEDGKTYELATGNLVDIHKIVNPTDLSTLPELAELKTRRNMLQETISSNDTTINRQKLASVERIIIPPFSSAEINDVTKKMDALEGYINYLKDKKTQEDWVNAVVKLKGSLNTYKYILCYNEAVARINKEINFTENSIKDDDDKLTPAVDLSTAYYALLDVVNKKIAELQTSIVTVAPSTLLEKESQKYENGLIAGAITGKYTDADLNLKKYMAVSNILGGLKIDIPLELSILEPLLPQAAGQLFTVSGAGASQEYKDAKNAKSSAATLSALKKQQILGLTNMVSEVKSLLGYIKERNNDSAKLQALLSPILTQCLNAIMKIPKDDLQADTDQTLRQLLDWLNAELALLKGNGMDKATLEELQKLDTQIKTLTNQYLDALQDRDLSLAESIKDEIDSLADQKADIFGNASADQSKLQEQKMNLQNQLDKALASGDNGLAAQLLNQLSSVQASLNAKSSSTDPITSAANANLEALCTELKDLLAANSFPQALTKVGEITSTLKASPETTATAKLLLKDILPTVESKQTDAIGSGKLADAGNLDKIKAAINALLGTDSAAASQNASSDALKASLADMVSSILSQLGLDANSTQGMLAQVVVLDKLKQAPEFSGLKDWINGQQDGILSRFKGSNVIKDAFTSKGICYANLRQLGYAMGRRYVWLPNQPDASLAKGGSIVIFTKNTAAATINGKPQKLPAKALVSKGKFYVPLDPVTGKLEYMWFTAGKSGKVIVYPAALDKQIQALMK